MWSAVNRINSDGEALAPEEKVSLFTAMKAVTIEAARSLQRDGEIGTIAVGKQADFVILGQNPFKVEPVAIKDVPVIATVFGGSMSLMSHRVDSQRILRQHHQIRQLPDRQRSLPPFLEVLVGGPAASASCSAVVRR